MNIGEYQYSPDVRFALPGEVPVPVPVPARKGVAPNGYSIEPGNLIVDGNLLVPCPYSRFRGFDSDGNKIIFAPSYAIPGQRIHSEGHISVPPLGAIPVPTTVALYHAITLSQKIYLLNTGFYLRQTHIPTMVNLIVTETR
jgi:hypothetical protein